mmetsp:Transcript_55062/g.154534  ORF Transcript_55062/g.154534 Transcript_55062/m.154534 type:complete len:319 (+) Transcript_55062:112-1068(+)
MTPLTPEVELGALAPAPVGLADDIAAAATAAAAGEIAAAQRRSVSVSHVGAGVRAYTPTLWHARERQRSNERPKQERDSLRSRSNEGRPGSRKHRRWSQSMDLVRVLQKAAAANGEGAVEVDPDAPQELMEHRPSAFYRLIEYEGASRALEALAAVENRRPRSRPRRPKTDAQVSREQARAVRSGFGDNWHYVHSNSVAKELLLEIEDLAGRAFTAAPAAEAEEEWVLHWDGLTISTTCGSAPPEELAISGLDPCQRKYVHQFARIVGLHSSSREGMPSAGGGDGKILTMRPPRRSCADGAAWAPPFSVAQVLGAVAA